MGGTGNGDVVMGCKNGEEAVVVVMEKMSRCSTVHSDISRNVRIRGRNERE